MAVDGGPAAGDVEHDDVEVTSVEHRLDNRLPDVEEWMVLNEVVDDDVSVLLNQGDGTFAVAVPYGKSSRITDTTNVPSLATVVAPWSAATPVSAASPVVHSTASSAAVTAAVLMDTPAALQTQWQ